MEYNVSSGRISSGITLGADDTMTIFSKGIASKTTVVSGGSMLVKTGGSAVVTTLNDGLMDTESAAYIQSLTIGSEGVFYLSARVSVVNPIVLSSGGVVHVFYSGAGSGVTYNMSSGGQVFVHSGGVFESTNVKDGASAVINSGGTATSTTCINSGNLILSGGTAINTGVYSRGVLMVSRGGVAQDVIVTSDGTANVSGLISGGTVSGASATINCLYRGCVSAVTVSWNGIINANSGGVVSDCVVDTRGMLNLSDGGRTYGATVNSGGYCHVFSRGSANSATINSGGYCHVSSGGTANFTTTNNQGSMFVSDGGKINSTTVNLSGLLVISSGGTANFTTVNSRGSMWVSSGGSVFGTTIYGSMYVNRSASAVSTTVGSGGDFGGQFGAVMDHTTILSGGRMNFSGTASNTVVSSGAGFTLGYGSASHTVVLAGGRMYILSGCIANDTTIYAGVSFTNVGIASNTTVSSGGKLYVDGASGGSAFETTLAFGGSMYISSGLASNTTVCSGASMSALQARVNDTTVDGIMEVRSGRVNSTTVNSGGTMNLYYDDAYNVTVNSGGELYLSEGIILHSTTVRSGGSMVVVKWGVSATDNTVIDGGVLEVLSGGTMTAQAVASNLTARNGGTIAIDSGGTLRGAVAGENGLVTVQNGATASNLVLSSGGVLNVSSGGLVKTATVNAGGVVTGVLRKATGLIFSGGTLDFDISNTAPFGEYIVDSATTLFTNDGISWTLTVNDSQANGTYNLMEYAYEFDTKVITAESPLTVKNTSGAKLGTLTVGETVKIGDVDYTLNLSNDHHLTVTISGTTPPPIPGGTAKSDIDGNGVSDVMFVWTGEHGDGNYQHGYWMNGTSEWQSANSNHPAEWDNLGCYDMTGDGKADSVLFGNVTSEAGIHGAYIGYYADANDLPDGSTWVNIGYLTNEENIDWKNKVGNLTGNASGVNSIVWYAPELYALGVWTDGTENWITLSNDFGGDAWTLVGCGDFNGDGKAQVVMALNGGEVYYTVGIDGTSSELTKSDSGWEVRAIGDFSGDDKDDIVAFHKETGLVAMWGDGLVSNWSQLGQLDANDWFIVGAGDYNADAKDDLLVRQISTGMLGYYASGNMETGWVELGRGVDMQWTVIA